MVIVAILITQGCYSVRISNVNGVPMTCILEMDGILWKGNGNMISIEDIQKKLLQAFFNAGIKFTIHWGKNAAWSFPGLMDYMYGNNDDIWKD